jgi:hypothetical protein
MPLKTIQICPKCEKKTCDGSLWRIVSIIPTIGKHAGKETIEEDIEITEGDISKPRCGLEAFGRGSAIKGMPIPKGTVGTRATRFYSNWMDKCNVVYEKIEE